MKVDLNLVSIEAEDLIITLKHSKLRKRVNFDDNSGDYDGNDNDDDDDENENENNL